MVIHLEKLRKEINEIDAQMRELFEKRMDVSKRIGEYKKKHQLPVYDPEREHHVIKNNTAKLNDQQLAPLYEDFLIHLMLLSKKIQ